MNPETVDAEVVEEHGQELVPQLATVQVTPAEAKEQNEQINAVIREVLVEGKNGDYWKIPGTPAPTLLQPGAETLQRFFGLGRKLSDPELGSVEIDGKQYFSAMVKCSVTNASERVLSEAFGYCDDTEKGPQGPGSKWKGNRHTIIQIATKRAYVTAIKNATGTSNHFTADLEDSQQEKAPKSLVEDRLASDDEKLLLAGLYAKKKPGGASLDEAMQWVASYKQKGESRLWVAVQVLGLMLKPDPLDIPQMRDDLERLGPEPELPPEPIPGQTSIEDAQDTPF